LGFSSLSLNEIEHVHCPSSLESNGSSCPHTDFNKIAALGESGNLDFSALVDKTRHFSEINEGFAEMRAGELTRVVLTF
jgi:Zn-dependent alcohol dehydrogenase